MGILGVSGLGFSWKVSRGRVPTAEGNGEEEEEGDQEEEKEKEEEEEEEEEDILRDSFKILKNSYAISNNP